MRDPKGSMSRPDESMTDEERERFWQESERERQALMEAWKDMYRKRGQDPDQERIDWQELIESERDE